MYLHPPIKSKFVKLNYETKEQTYKKSRIVQRPNLCVELSGDYLYLGLLRVECTWQRIQGNAEGDSDPGDPDPCLVNMRQNEEGLGLGEFRQEERQDLLDPLSFRFIFIREDWRSHKLYEDSLGEFTLMSGESFCRKLVFLGKLWSLIFPIL